MIIRTWGTFKIDLPSLVAHMGSDGCYADENTFTIFLEDTEENQTKLDTYLASLTEEGEAWKLAYPARVQTALVSFKYSLLGKRYADFSEVERKLLFGLPLTDTEILSIVTQMEGS